MNKHQIALYAIIALILIISGYYIIQYANLSSPPETESLYSATETISITSYTSTSSIYTTISVTEAHQLIQTNLDYELILLDVRTIDEYTSEHIEGALNIPLQELQEKVGMLDKNKIILVYCRSGVRSLQASQILVDNGFTRINNIEGGIVAWHNEGYPLIRSEENTDCDVCPD
jgi:rhodanese-related sulfurtransferase